MLVRQVVYLERSAMLPAHFDAIKVDQVGVALVTRRLISLLRLLCFVRLRSNHNGQLSRPMLRAGSRPCAYAAIYTVVVLYEAVVCG